MALGGILKHSALVSIAFVIGVGALLPLLTVSVSANIKTASPTDEARSTSYYKTLRTCFNNEMNTNIQLTASDNGIAPPSKWFTDNQSYGYIYPEGKTDCKDIVPKALNLWGWGTDYSAFLKELGFKYNASDAKWSVANRNNLRNNFDSAVQKKYYGVNFSGDPSQSGAAKYVMYLNVFQKACNAKDLGSISSISNTSYKAWLDSSTAGQGTQVDENTANISGTKDGSYVYFSKVNVIEPAGEPSVLSKVAHGYAYQASSPVANAGWNGGSAEPSGNVRIYGYHNGAVEQSCHQIQKGVTDNSTAWLAWSRANPDKATPPPTQDGSTTGDDGDEAPVSSCAVEGIGWILCPVINFLAGVADASFNFLADSFLRTDPKVFNTEDQVYATWAIMRNIANISFVIAFLFIVFSQLTGVGISNYGVKKMLPRIVVAAILVNVSYFISQLAIDVSNILGYSIRDVFNGVIGQVNSNGSSSDPGVMSDFATGGGGGFVAIAGAILGAGLAVAAVSLMLSAFGPILLAVVLALLLIFFILIARQAIIVILVILSPLAFVAFLLPNTEHLFKAWRKMLTAMLLLFPIIALVYGGSALASSLIGISFSGVGGTEGPLFGQIISAAVLVLPLFAVPILLKKSLDGVPQVGKFANKWAGRGLDGVSNRVKDGNRASYVGRGNAIRKQNRSIYADRKFAENVSKGGIGALAAKGVAFTPKGIYARNAVGRIADEASEKAFENDISAAAVSMRNTHSDPDNQIPNVAMELTNAIQKGDKIKARAAQSILLNSGGAGIDTLTKTLSAAETADKSVRNSEVGQSLRTGLNNAGLKGKDNSLATWAYSDNTIDSIRNGTAKTLDGKMVSAVQGLNAVELAGQRGGVISAAVAKNLISPEQARAVLESNVSKDMDANKKALFAGVAAKATTSPTGTSAPTTAATPAAASGPGFGSGDRQTSTGGQAQVSVDTSQPGTNDGLLNVKPADGQVTPNDLRAQQAAANARNAALAQGQTPEQARIAADDAFKKNGGA
jgi:hypothetical protein